LWRLRSHTGTGAHTTPAGWLAPQAALTGLEKDVNRRVKAVLVYLSQRSGEG